MCGFEAVPAAARIKAPVTEHEHGRLQDVAAASVVLETAIIKVHGKAQRLEIESHCKKQKKREVERKKRPRDTVRTTRNGRSMEIKRRGRSKIAGLDEQHEVTVSKGRAHCAETEPNYSTDLKQLCNQRLRCIRRSSFNKNHQLCRLWWVFLRRKAQRWQVLRAMICARGGSAAAAPLRRRRLPDISRRDAKMRSGWLAARIDACLLFVNSRGDEITSISV